MQLINPEDILEPWIVVSSFQNSWVNNGGAYPGAAYHRQENQMVHLRGLVRSGTVSGSGTIFTLPSGYRPGARLMFPVICASGSTRQIGQCDITTVGEVIAIAGANTYWSLDGIVFRAEQ
jgi:hypothetical protein